MHFRHRQTEETDIVA